MPPIANSGYAPASTSVTVPLYYIYLTWVIFNQTVKYVRMYLIGTFLKEDSEDQEYPTHLILFI